MIAPAMDFLIEDVSKTPEDETSNEEIERLERKKENQGLTPAEHVELQEMKENKGEDPHVAQAKTLREILNKNIDGHVESLSEVYSLLDQMIGDIKDNLNQAIQDLKDEDEIWNKVGKESSDIESKLSEVEGEELQRLEEAKQKTQAMMNETVVGGN